MGLMTTTINGIALDVYYSYESEDDPYGTGDSPTAHYVEIIAIEAADSTVDITELLSNSIIEQIEDEIIAEEA
jgi:hypothetical protein